MNSLSKKVCPRGKGEQGSRSSLPSGMQVLKEAPGFIEVSGRTRVNHSQTLPRRGARGWYTLPGWVSSLTG